MGTAAGAAGVDAAAAGVADCGSAADWAAAGTPAAAPAIANRVRAIAPERRPDFISCVIVVSSVAQKPLVNGRLLPASARTFKQRSLLCDESMRIMTLPGYNFR
jgi:hypothetical protein